MKSNLLMAVRLTLVCVFVLIICYPLLILAIAKFAPARGSGQKLLVQNRIVGYALEGQLFSRENYFWGRPSAVGYNAAGSGGSNKGTTNKDYLQEVQARLDVFMKKHPYATLNTIPAEMITASGSGLDPDVSPAAARIQVQRVADIRKIDPGKVLRLVNQHINRPLFGLFGTERVNVLQLNIALDKLK